MELLNDDEIETVLRGDLSPDRADLAELDAAIDLLRQAVPTHAPEPSPELAAWLQAGPVRVGGPSVLVPLHRRGLRWIAGLGVGAQALLASTAAAAAIGTAGLSGVLPHPAQRLFDETLHRSTQTDPTPEKTPQGLLAPSTGAATEERPPQTPSLEQGEQRDEVRRARGQGPEGETPATGKPAAAPEDEGRPGVNAPAPDQETDLDTEREVETERESKTESDTEAELETESETENELEAETDGPDQETEAELETEDRTEGDEDLRAPVEKDSAAETEDSDIAED